MLRIIQIVIALGFLSQALAAYGDLRIYEGGDSGQLQIQDSNGYWGAICDTGFDDDAGDVACRQLGYVQSSDVYSKTYSNGVSSIFVCTTYCDGDEDRLTDCALTTYCSYCSGFASVTCTDGLTAGQIVGIVVGVVVFIALIATCVTLCICCLSPTCPCYYHRNRSTETVVVAAQAQQSPQVVTSTTTNTNTINYQPSPPAPPAYYPAAGYQPYPAAPPPVNY